MDLKAAEKAIKDEIAGQRDFHVVCVDDEPAMLEMMAELFASTGVKVHTTVGLDEAMGWVRQWKNDLCLVISDLRMPGMDGFQFREAVRPLAPDAPFVILSGFLDTEIALKGLELKICAFLAKPAEPDKLAQLLAGDVLARIRAIKEDRELKAGFVSETQARVEEAEELLLAMEEEEPGNREHVNSFFGLIHTIKGASSFFEPKHLHRFVHRYEDLLRKVQRDELPLNEGVSAALFRGLDVIKELFNEFRVETFQERDLEALLKTLDVSAPAGETAALRRLQRAEKPAEGEAAREPAAAPAAGAAPARAAPEDVRVAVSLLDEFMQLSGEVTVVRNMLNKCVRSIERQYPGDRDVLMLGELLEELHKINSGVQGKISEIRKVPVRLLVKPVRRGVRDVAKQLGKRVELEIAGEELRIDTSIADVLNNSLLHIVKNSVDHGLETPQERAAAGKDEAGKVVVRFSERNEKVIIEIEDDGRGLNVEAIKAKMLKNNLATPAEIAALSNEELYAMIFESGFSTAAVVTDPSGRDVGMSMVKDSVDSIGGEIQIQSRLGQGAVFRLVLPIPKSVLIASCLSVVIGRTQFGLVQDDIQRVLVLGREQREKSVREVQGGRMLLLDGQLIPIGDVRSLMKLGNGNGHGNGQGNGKNRSTDLALIVLKSPHDSRRVAIEVDRILDTEDTVIKAIHPALNSHQLYRGATFLDDGTLGLILNTAGILESLGVRHAPRARPARAAGAGAAAGVTVAGPERRALLFGLTGPGQFAVDLSEIFRLEELREADLRHSGRSTVVPYRNGVLQVVDLGPLLSGGPAPGGGGGNGRFPVIVVRQADRLIGLRVSCILDMVPLIELKSELARPARAIAGHFFDHERTVALISVADALRLAAAGQSGSGSDNGVKAQAPLALAS